MKEFAINLDVENRKPLYEQIYEAFKEAILEGRIVEGERLPSTRFQAEYLSCSRSTVELAYEQLLSEGYIKSQPYRGYFACDVKELYHLARRESPELISNTKEDPQSEEYKVDFSPNGIELTQFPFAYIGKTMKNLLLDEGEDILKRSDSFGDLNLRQAICDYLFRARNVKCNVHQIVVGAGNEYLLMLLSQMLGQDHIFAMESPSYLRAYQTLSGLQYPVKTIDMDNEGMIIADLEASGANIAYVMPSHQFPLGIVMPMKRRLELLQWASSDDKRFIIEDDYDSEFRYKGKPIPALQGMDPYARVIYMGTFSRSIAPTTRVSYMVLPPQLVDDFHKKCGFYACTVPNIMQQCIYHFMMDGMFEKNLNRMRGIYKGKHDILLQELKSCCWAKRIWGDYSGMHLLVEVDTDLTEAQLEEACRARGVKLYGISQYYIGMERENPRPVFLFGYGGLSEREMKTGIEIITEVIGK